MRKALVTGHTGHVGGHLVKHLDDQGWQIVGFSFRDGLDITNYEQVRNVLDIERPDAIFHLAAQAYVPESFVNPKRTFEVNTLGSLNILEAVRQLGLKTRIHLAGTSEEYGDGTPREDAMLEPKSPYAISKMAMDYLGQLYARSYGMNVVVTRAFNHTGPDRGEQYAESSFAKQIAEVEAGKRDVIEHGNLESVRNYTDVRDVVRAYVMAIDLDSGVYNICGSQNVTMQEVLDTLVRLSGRDIKTKVNQALYRPSDFSFKKPRSDTFRDLTGWAPEIPLEQTLKDLLDYWRAKCAS
jgi:GDP-4-dehydro-6-deoxy-D-mannose reductase